MTKAENTEKTTNLQIAQETPSSFYCAVQELFTLKWVMMGLSLKSSIQGWYLTLLPMSIWKRQFRLWNKRTGWISRDVFLEVVYWRLWAWFFRWPSVSWKEFLHPCEVKNNTGHKGLIILSLADSREKSVTDNKPLHGRMHNGTYYDILIIPDLRCPSQRRMNAFKNNWQDFCCWVGLQGSCLAEWGSGPAHVQQTWRGLKDFWSRLQTKD